jgi:hypothetical protein
MARPSVRDLAMMYRGTVVRHELGLIYVRDINEEYVVDAFSLKNQELIRFTYEEGSISNLKDRLGYLNLGTNCTFLYRSPRRVYKVGISKENVSVKRGDHALTYAERKAEAEVLATMNTLSLYNTLSGNYPSLVNAYKQAKVCNGCVAFDRQFAIDYTGTVYYKCEKVGSYDVSGGIRFEDEFNRLFKLLP